MSIQITNRIGRRSIASLAAVLVLSSGALTACGSSDNAMTSHSSSMSQTKVVALHSALQSLWADHMQYTYGTVNAFFHNQAELKPSLDRLLKNQKELGAAIVPFYGQPAGNKLAALLTTHIQDAVPVLTAAKNGDKAALTKAMNAWYANAKQIADFLSSANPKNWPAAEMESMMKTHIDQTTTYAVDLLKGDYAKSIKDYDLAFAHMAEMAGMLADGIAAQFPGKV